MSTKEDIIREILAGETPYQLSKRYPRTTVYRIYNDMVNTGQLLTGPQIVGTDDEEEDNVQPFIPVTQKGKTKSSAGTGAEVVSFGPDTLPASAVNRIRGVLGISLRPKVLSCPMPELLYPAMVISVTEFGFPAMRPDDFIDTVLYQWLEACDIIPYAFMKKSEIEDWAKKYNDAQGAIEEAISDETFRREHKLVTTDEVRKAVLTPVSEGDGEISDIEDEDESDIVMEEDEVTETEPEIEHNEPEVTDVEPPKPTVGELLSKLHITSIQREVENGSSEGHTESNNP